MTEAGSGAARFPALSAVPSVAIYAIEFAAIAASYLSLAEAALLLPGINPAATPFWPPTGLALAFVLLRGYRIWPAILVSSFCASAVPSGTMTDSLLLQSMSIAIGTTLAALAGSWLINRQSYGTNTFSTPLVIGRFVLIAFVPTAMMSSTSAIMGQLSASDLNLSSLVTLFLGWWLADWAGTILITPVVVLWAMPPRQAVARWDLLETTAILVSTAVIGAVTFLPITISAFNELLSQQRQYSFLILLPLIWASLRVNQRAAATAALIFCGLAAWSLPDAGRSLAATGLNGSLLFLLALSISTSVASLLLSTVIAGYRGRQEGAKRHFQIFVESVSDYAIFVLDPYGHVASWNEIAEKIIGYTSEKSSANTSASCIGLTSDAPACRSARSKWLFRRASTKWKAGVSGRTAPRFLSHGCLLQFATTMPT